jgi:hypothetical protein
VEGNPDFVSQQREFFDNELFRQRHLNREREAEWRPARRLSVATGEANLKEGFILPSPQLVSLRVEEAA